MKFVDLVRNWSTTVGTGNITLGLAVDGFESIADALVPGDQFYYSIVNIDLPAQTEAGIGTVQPDGTISRAPKGGVFTNFNAGNKQISLVVGAAWFTAADGGSPAAIAAAAAAAADATQTAADRVQTGLDRVATGDDSAQTAADRTQTGLDAAATAADRTATHADRLQADDDATATAADRVQTGLDRVATGNDAAATAGDRTAVHADRVAVDASVASASKTLGLATGVAALVLATGAYANANLFRTEGYYSADDNGQAWYRRMASIEAATQGELLSSDGVRLGLTKGQELTPEMFGAKGDNLNDDYAAWHALTLFVTNNKAASIRCGLNKTYFINQHVVAGNGITDIQFIACNFIKIEGAGSKISFQGNFDRNVSTTRGLSVIYQECNNIFISDLEVTGNVDQTTNSGGFNETICYGQLFYGCNFIFLSNVYCHHMATDGFAFQQSVNQFGGVKIACRRATMVNCKGTFNGRMGVFISQCRGFYAYNCNFDDQAQFTGTYGVLGVNGHAPRSGLDIEPNFNTSTASPNTMDINTGDIVFERCTFRRNKSGLLFAQLPGSIDTVTFRDCSGDAVGSLGNSAGIILAIPNATVDNCQFDLGDNYFKFCYSSDPTVTGTLKDSKISGTYMLLNSQLNSGKAVVENNEFICTCTAPYAHGGATPLLASNNNMIFERNRIFIPAAAYIAGAGGAHAIIGIGGMRRQRFNRYETDLTATALGQTTAHYHVNNYSGFNTVSEEHFVGTAPGTADTFRLAASSNFDTNFRFTRVPGYTGLPGVGALGNANQTLTLNDKEIQQLDVALTAARTITLPAPGNVGRRFRIGRTANATGAFNLNVNTSTGTLLKALTGPGSWVDFVDDGTQYQVSLPGGTAASLDYDTDTAMAANSDSRIPTQKAVKAYVAGQASGAATQPYASGRYYVPEGIDIVGAGAALTAGSIYLTPGFLPKAVSISALIARITTLAAGGNCQISLYASDPVTGDATGAPLYTSASQSTAAAGIVQVAPTLTIGPGVYWFGIQADNATVIFESINPTAAGYSRITGPTSSVNLLNGSSAIGRFKAGTFGTWPTLTGNYATDGFAEITSRCPAWGFKVA